MDARLPRLLSAPVGARGRELSLSDGVRRTLLVFLGLGCGLSPAFSGYFDLSVWGPIGLVLIAMTIGLLLANPAVPTGLAAIAISGLLLFAIWSLISMGWAESADRALTEGDRWALYAVFLLMVLLLVTDRRDGEAMICSVVVGVLGVAGYELLKMLAGEGSPLFGGSRLLEPLGYTNGLGGYFLLGLWPLVALAERTRSHALGGAAAAAATLLAALVLMTDSRGTVFAFAVSAAVLLLLLPGRSRRAWLLLAVLAALGIAWAQITPITAALAPGQFAPADATIQRGAEWSLLVAVGVGFVWALGSWVAASLAERSDRLRANLPRVSAVLLCGIAVAAIVAGSIAVKDPLGRVSDQYNAFTELKPANPSSRFTSGGGNRYDYWRIAWEQFVDHPLEGVGAGNFDRTYFLERNTGEDVRQAHSIELQTLGETGAIGALALGTFLIAVFAGILRRSRSARRDGTDMALTVAAAGMFTVWLAQTSVDWLHLIPGITGIALGGAAVLLTPPGAGDEGRLTSLPVLGTVVALVLAVVAIVFLGRPTLAEHFRIDAQQELTTRPLKALDEAQESLSLNPDSVQGYYLKAAALARLHEYQLAKAALGDAIKQEPHNYVSWALLGDLSSRYGAVAEARRAYDRAARLNPRDREFSSSR